MTGHLLDDVDFLGRVESPRRKDDRARVTGTRHRETDGIEQRREVVGGQVGAEDPIHGTDANVETAVLGGKVLGAGVDATGVHDDVRAGLGEQFDETGDGRRHAVRIDAALEACRCLGAQVRPGHGLPDADEREPSDLERDRGRRVVDLGVETTHDSPDADRNVVGVADEQIGSGEGPLLAVERRESFALTCQPDTESAPAQRVQVVGVVGLVQLQHHVVADVDHVADRAHARRQ